MTPPSESIGLAFGARTTLRVQYLDPGQSPVEGVQVSFAISGSAGGSALSNRTTDTHSDGVAAVDVVAGAARASFRVVASASGAPPATFYVTVSDVGFAALAVTPRHVGARTGTTAVEARLYPATSPCATLDPKSPPQSPFAPRTLSGFDQPADWTSLPPMDGYAVIAWAHDSAGTVIASGCADLAQHELVAGGNVSLELALADVAPGAEASYRVLSTLDLTPLENALIEQSTFWKAASCPLGTAQIVLDCAIDALDSGDALDCVVQNPGSVAQALQAKRGTPDGNGCRPATIAGGAASLDATLEAQMSVSLGPGAASLKSWLGQLGLLTRLVPAASSATHELLTATLGSGATAFMQDLTTTSRPIITASAVMAFGPIAMGLGQHGFTLRLGALLADAYDVRFAASHLSLGTNAVLHTANVLSKTSCDAVSYDVCPAAGQANDCLTSACNTALPVLDTGLARPFTRLSGTGLDLVLSGTAMLVDADMDGVAEAMSSGVWAASLGLDDGTTTPITGSFTATSP